MADAYTKTDTTLMAPEIALYYSKVFLDNLNLVQSYNYLVEKKSIPGNIGKTVYFARETHFSVVTAALSEATNPTAEAFSAEQVSAAVAEYGLLAKISSFFELITLDSGLEQKTKEMSYNAGLTLDTILRDVLIAGGTTQFAGAKTVLTDVNSTDTMSVAELRKAVKTLDAAGVPRFENGNFRGVICTQGIYELQGDTAAGNWINIGLYNSAENAQMLKDGVVKTLYGVDIKPSNNQYTVASTTTVYHSLVAGKGAAAEIDIAGSGGAKVIYKKPGDGDTSNGLNMFSTLGWKINAYAAKVLEATRIIVIKHA